MSTPAALSFPCLLQQFFVQRLLQQLHASPRTVAAYRDSFRLLLDFAHRRLRKKPAELTLEDLNAALILDFLRISRLIDTTASAAATRALPRSAPSWSSSHSRSPPRW